MKRLLLTITLSLFFSVVWCKDGDTFTTNHYGLRVTFMIISESERTCQVGDGINSSIPEDYDGIISIPYSVNNGYKVISIGKNAYRNCKKLSSIIIPDNITSIQAKSFLNCTRLSTIDIPNSITMIGDSAFYGCKGITSVFIPNSINNIGCGVFGNCQNIQEMRVDPNNRVYDSRDNCNAIISKKDRVLISGTSTTKIPNGVKQIGDMAFIGCTMKSINIPNSVKTIGNYAFSDCVNLSSIVIQKNLTTIGNYAFSGCKELKTVKMLKESPVSITTGTFDVSVTQKNTILQVPKGCIQAYSNSMIWKNFKMIEELRYYTLKTECDYGDIQCANANLLEEEYEYDEYGEINYGSIKRRKYSVAEGTNVIFYLYDENYGCLGCSQHTHSDIVRLNDNGTDVTQYIIYDGNIDDELEWGNEMGFYHPSDKYYVIKEINNDREISLISTRWGPLVNNIKYTFIDNEAIVLSNDVVDELDYYSTYNTYTGSIKIPSSVKYKDKEYKVTDMMDGVFAACHGLVSVIIPSGVKSIRYEAFKWDSRLRYVDVPKSVKHIGKQAFYGCNQLKSLRVRIEDPIALADSTFSNLPCDATLYVPNGCKEKYLNAPEWNKFKNIKESEREMHLTIKVSGDGFVDFDSTMIRNTSLSFQVMEGEARYITICPDNHNYMSKITINGIDFTTLTTDTVYVIENISEDIDVDITFSHDHFFTLSVQSLGKGSVDIGEQTIEYYWQRPYYYWEDVDIVASNSSAVFSLKGGSVYGFTIRPSWDTRIQKVIFNGEDVTSFYVSEHNDPPLKNVLLDNSELVVVFEKKIESFEDEGIRYGIISEEKKEVEILNGNYNDIVSFKYLTSTYYNNTSWKITGIADHAFAACPNLVCVRIPSGVKYIGHDLFTKSDNLSAIIWDNDNVTINDTIMGEINNPNLLLYVNKESINKTSINNVIINNKAESIVLHDAEGRNNFYCPQSFSASKISYSHNYHMISGINECRGWETIALPFSVKSIRHENKGELTPFKKYDENSTAKPFWLYNYSSSGWEQAENINAYTPYIICMPNNAAYNDEYNLEGVVTFSAKNVQVGETKDLLKPTHANRTFVPNFNTCLGGNVLNVKNDFSSNTSDYVDGSVFVPNLRKVHPFEAYMVTTSGVNAPLGIFDDLPTEIPEILFHEPHLSTSHDIAYRVISLSGQVVRERFGGNFENVTNGLSRGVYFVNGKKIVIK